MATREEALQAIEDAKQALADVARKAEIARRLSTESGILTAGDIIAEGIGEVRADVFARIPTLTDYVGTQSTQADVDAMVGLGEEVKTVATQAGAVVAMCAKAAIKFAAMA